MEEDIAPDGAGSPRRGLEGSPGGSAGGGAGASGDAPGGADAGGGGFDPETGGVTLAGLIDRLEDHLAGETIAVEDVVKNLGQRAFGPLFVFVALVAILPTGAIPGMSALTGALMTLLSVQLIFGARRIWLPDRLERQTIPRARLVASLERMRRPARTIDRVLAPRLEWAARKPVSRLVGVVAFALSLLMFPLIVVPFGAFPSSLPILAFGLGLAARDGLVILVALAGSMAALAAGLSMLPGL